jgi:membrane protein YqaA with SNARE-associated domain
MYDWTIHWSKTKYSELALFFIAFMESSFFPVPPDVLLIPMVIAQRQKWLRKALICTLGSVLGALLGYYIGVALWDVIGVRIADFYNLHEAINTVGKKYQDNAFLTIFTAAFTPIPFKAITITAGLFKISLGVFVVACAIGRAARFFIVAFALHIFGKKIETSIEKYFNLLSIAFVILLVGGFLVLKYLL